MDSSRMAEWLATSNLTHPYMEDPPDMYTYQRRRHDESDETDSDLSSNEQDEQQEDAPVMSQPQTSGKIHHPGDDLDPIEEEVRMRSLRDFPKWFKPGPFLYNGRIFLASLPGILLTLATGGDFFLAVLTMGTLVVYLFYQAGEKNKALFAYVVAFGCCEISVVYSALPFLWLSVFNIVLVVALNMYTVLTGAWGLMASNLFVYNDPELAKTLETSLFSFYPAVSIVLVTWLIVSLTTVTVAPYVFMLLGFVVLQFFMAPVPSSFHKPNVRSRESIYVLDPAVTGAMALTYLASTPFVFVLVTVYHTPWKLFSVYNIIVDNVVEWVFLGFAGTFLATWMHLRIFMETSGIPYDNLVKLRLGAGLLALLLLSPVLQKYGFTIHLLPWISVGVAIHALYGFLVKQRQKRGVSLLAVGGLLLLYVFIFTKLPWRVQYFVSGDIHVSIVHVMLFANVAMCILCTYVSVYSSKDTLGALVTLQSVGFILSEKLLASAKLYPTTLMLLSAAFAIYLFLRLHYSEKLLWQHAWMSMSLHLTKVPDLCVTHSHLNHGSSTAYDLYSWMATFSLALMITKVVIFEHEKEISTQKWACYLAGTVAVNAFSAPGLWTLVYTQLMASLPSMADLLGICMLVCGGVSAKLSFTHQVQWRGAKHVGPALCIMAVFMTQLQPEFNLTWEENRKWLVVLNLLGCFGVIPLAARVKSAMVLSILGQILGFPLGIAIYTWEYSDSLMWSYLGLSGVTAGLCVTMMLFSWRDVSNLDSLLIVIFVSLMYCCSGFGLLYTLWPLEEVALQPSVMAISIVQLVIAAVFKVLSFREKLGDLMSGEEEVPLLPLWGNCAAVAAFVMFACFFNPGIPVEAWVCTCSSTLLMLQRDNFLCRRLSSRNSQAPVLYVVTLTLLGSSMFNSSAFWYRSALHFIQGCLELIFIISTLPMYFIFVTLLWNEKFYISDRLAVFLTPLNTVLFFIATSKISLVLGAFGIAVGIWLIKFKLPLHVER